MSAPPNSVGIFLFLAFVFNCLPVFSDDVSPGPTSPYSSSYYYTPAQSSISSGPQPPSTPQPDDTPSPTIPDSRDRNKPTDEIEETADFNFMKSSQRCIRSGDIIKFNGKNLSQLSSYKFAIRIQSNEVALTPLHITDNQLIVQIPEHSGLGSKQSYRIFLINKANLTLYSPIELTIHSCLFNDDINSNANHEVGEIVVLVDQLEVVTIKQEIKIMGLQLIESEELKALGKTLLIIKTTPKDLPTHIFALRKKFPNATIDFNNHYQHAAAKPRLYAPQMISWPQSCNNINFEAITIGIIDGLPDLTHPALVNQKIVVKRFLKESQQADMEHGTALAVILLGNQPDSGFTGLLSHATLLAAATLRQEKDTSLATTRSIIRALDWLMIHKVRLVNISLSGSSDNAVIRQAFAIAIQKRIIIFSAAGNGGGTAPKSYPAALPGVIAITAVDAAKHIYRQANQGDYIDFAAPGVDIWVANKHSKGKYSSGTSYASPYAMAIAAFYLRKNPSLSPSLLYAAIKENSYDLGKSGHDPVYGWGLIRAPKITCE